ncbi:MAG TPA: hypothetical protein VFR23_11560 [Jiangellaceae bacterium]|nr:hypothetical protein [Jiangellaceae bacterium]
MTATAETLTIGRTTYRVERDVDEGYAITQLGQLHGPRGSLASVVRFNNSGRLTTMNSSGGEGFRGVSRAKLHEILTGVFGEA